LAGSVILYLVVLVVGTARRYVHLDIVLGLIEYAPLLVGLLWYLRAQRHDTEAASSLPRLKLLPVIACFALLAIPLSWFATQGLVNPDESGYSFLARIYQSGRLMADPLVGATQNVRDTPAELFYANHILRPYGWFPKFPPGWPLVLSLGYRISARWLPNPLFGALQLWIIAAIGWKWFSQETGALAALFAALSPFYLFNSVGMMSHALCAILAATACLALCQGFSTGKLGYYAAMFACLAGTFQVRPFTGFVLTCVLTAAALWLAREDRPRFLRVLAIGAVFGGLAIAGVALYNHAYTGRWLVSPYAEAAGGDTPPELSLNPVVIVRGMLQYGPFMLLETLLGAFPFLHLLAGYAVIREKRCRNEVWILAALYVALILAYLAHPNGYAVFFGERFHFEGFFALVLLAARGTQLLIENWQIQRRGFVFALLLLCCLQVVRLGFAAEVVSRQGEPYRKVRAAVAAPDVYGLVFLQDSPGFVAKHFNLNDADWRHASRIYLVDADAEHRAEWACRFGFSNWTVASYDKRAHSASLERSQTECPAPKVP
jgi:hypothetical protein